MVKLFLTQLTVASNFIFSNGVFGAQLHAIRNVHGVRNHLLCYEGFKPECGDYIIQASNHACHNQVSDRYCQMPSTYAGDNGQQMNCIPKSCIVHGNQPRCNRSSKRSKLCKQTASAAGVVQRNVNFLVGDTTDLDATYTDDNCAGNTDCIRIPSFRISCQSDTYVDGATYGGAIIYDAGGMPGVRPGYMILARIDTASTKAYIKSSGRKEGQVHGETVYKRFHKNPRELYQDYPNLKIAGFAYYQGQIQFNSGTFNGRNWKLNKNMVEDERVVVTALLDAWKQHGIAVNYSPAKLVPYVCSALTGTTSLPTSMPISDITAKNYILSDWPECTNDVLRKWPQIMK